jgi:acyl carrier protein
VTPTEIAALIQKLLDLDQMAVEDNFFDVGGSSIQALTLISEIMRRYNVPLPLIEVIRNPTPEKLSRLIVAAWSDGAAAGAPGRPAGPDGRPR